MQHPVHLFKALSDQTRLSIVMFLREADELCVCDLCAGGPVNRSLKFRVIWRCWRESGLVLDRKDGKWVYYQLSPAIPAWAAAIIDSSWNCLREETRLKLKNRRARVEQNSHIH
ncbi:putative arsenic-efflux pump regulatory protein [Enterobacter cancerogenus]|uniref:Putative arsenic-efflux pump regulatory protein n=1 Tax=Enterobacter cancerogenus TaxID=69218 RepID=A0A484Z905_9ENTR|nr:putative arsenic-efflux pump regulatory protein [Enterobacter cancerogenus]